MKLSYQSSVRARLAYAFAGVILVFGIAIALCVARLASFNQGVGRITGPMLEQIETAGAWAQDVSESMRHARNMLIMDDKSDIQAQLDKINELTTEDDQYIRILSESVQSAEGKALLKETIAAREALAPLERDFARQVLAGDLKSAKQTLLTTTRPAQLGLIEGIQKLDEYYKTQVFEQADRLASSYRTMRMLVISLSSLAVAVALLLAFSLSRVIKRPLSEALRVLGEIEIGNYDAQVKITSDDEIGQTLQGLKRMQSALSERTGKERALAAENERTRTALDRVSVGVMVTDAEERITYANHAVSTLLKNHHHEVLQRLPQFDPNRLVGSSFRSLHQALSNQHGGKDVAEQAIDVDRKSVV